MNRTNQKKNIIQGVERNGHFSNCNLSTFPTEGRLMAVNDKYLALATIHMGSIQLVNSKNPMNLTKINSSFSLEKANILDMEFSPFNQGLLCFGNDNNKVFLATMKEEGENNIDINSECYLGHSKKVSFVNFNPIYSNKMCSGTSDGEAHVWESNLFKNVWATKISSNINDLLWNPNGSLIGITAKNRFFYSFDPRKKTTAFQVQVSALSTNEKFSWIGDNLIATIGWKKNGEKLLSLLDIRKMASQQNKNLWLSSITIDNYTSIITPFIDRELKLIYSVGKEESMIKIFDYNNYILKKNNEFASSELNNFSLLFDRQYLNKEKFEIDRMARYTKNANIYYISFYNQSGQDIDGVLYPSEQLNSPQMTSLEWFEGKRFERIPTTVYQNPNTKNIDNHVKQNNIINNEEIIVEEEQNPRKDRLSKLHVDFYPYFIGEKKSPNKFGNIQIYQNNQNNRNNQPLKDYKNLYSKLENDYKNLSLEYKQLQNKLFKKENNFYSKNLIINLYKRIKENENKYNLIVIDEKPIKNELKDNKLLTLFNEEMKNQKISLYDEDNESLNNFETLCKKIEIAYFTLSDKYDKLIKEKEEIEKKYILKNDFNSIVNINLNELNITSKPEMPNENKQNNLEEIMKEKIDIIKKEYEELFKQEINKTKKSLIKTVGDKLKKIKIDFDELYKTKENELNKKFNEINSKLNLNINEYIIKNKEKEKIIKELNNIISRYPFFLFNNEYIILLVVVTKDEKVIYSIMSKNTDKWNKVENKFYQEYPEYSCNKGKFYINNNLLDGDKTLEDNKLKNNDIIILEE